MLLSIQLYNHIARLSIMHIMECNTFTGIVPDEKYPHREPWG